MPDGFGLAEPIPSDLASTRNGKAAAKNKRGIWRKEPKADSQYPYNCSVITQGNVA